MSEKPDRLPIDDKLADLRRDIVNGDDENAMIHLFDLISGMQCKHKPDDQLTYRGRRLKALWTTAKQLDEGE